MRHKLELQELLLVGFHRKEEKNELMEKSKELRNTEFQEVSIVPDLTQQQRKEEAEMVRESERRNETRTAEEVAKNLEWMVAGRKGEKRLFKGTARQWGGEMRGRGRGMWRGGAERGGTGRGGRGAENGLLPGRGGMREAAWRPEAGTSRGTGSMRGGEAPSAVWRGMGWRATEERQRRNSKRTRGESDTEVERESRAPPAKH